MTNLLLPNASRALMAATRLPLAPGTNVSVDEAEAFNNSVDFKLRCAEYHLARLKETLKPFPARSFARTGGPNLFEVNLFLDGFLASLVSASDVFGHEINIYYGRPRPGPRFYLHEVINTLAVQGRAPTLVAHLQPELDVNAVPLPLLPRVKKYRNCSSHRSLIETATVLSATVTYKQQMTGSAPQMTTQCSLPDDPEQFPCTYNSGIQVIDFCERSFAAVATLVDDGYARLDQALTAANQLPL